MKAQYDSLIRQLIALRVKRGLSQQQVAQRAAMHRPTLARLERRSHAASLATLARVAEALGARVEVRIVESSKRA